MFLAWLQDKLESAQLQKDEAERRSREQAELTGLRCSALEQENAGREGGRGRLARQPTATHSFLLPPRTSLSEGAALSYDVH